MGRRMRFFSIGLLIFFSLLLPAGADERAFPEVRLETFPATPAVNYPWSIYILVNHPSPLEVEVRPPHFPPSLVLSRVRADTRLIADGERWTRVEFRFIPLRSDAIALGPFDVNTPLGRAFTDEIEVHFDEAISRPRFDPRFRWVTPIPTTSPGERVQLLLELTGWDPNRRIPEGFFWGRAPLNAIVGEGFPQTVAASVYHFPISVIPLEESNVILEAFSFNYDIYALDIPRIVIPVLPALLVEEERVLPVQAIPGEDTTRDIPFPQARERIFFLFQGEYDRVILRARALWNENRRAEALAEIRRNERDSFSGPFLVPLRQEIEQALDIGFTENERWRPFRIPLLVYAVFFITGISALVFLLVLRPRWLMRGKKLTLRWNRFMGVIVVMLVTGLFVIFLEGSLGDFPSGRASRNTAVLRGTYSYRIPDFRGAVNDWFNEGQPVIVGDYNGEWRLAETSDGRSGWVPRDAVITY